MWQMLKQVFINLIEKKVNKLVDVIVLNYRFKAELNHMVEEQLERYRRRCKEAGQTPCGVSDSEAEDNDVRVHRIFEWTDALRRLFREVVSLKLKTYEVSKLRATSAEDYVRNFFEIDVSSAKRFINFPLHVRSDFLTLITDRTIHRTLIIQAVANPIPRII